MDRDEQIRAAAFQRVGVLNGSDLEENLAPVLWLAGNGNSTIGFETGVDPNADERALSAYWAEPLDALHADGSVRGERPPAPGPEHFTSARMRLPFENLLISRGFSSISRGASGRRYQGWCRAGVPTRRTRAPVRRDSRRHQEHLGHP